MGGSVNFPVGREDSSTTGAVAELLNAFTFPTIIPLATDMAALEGLPDLPVPARPGVPTDDAGDSGVSGVSGEDVPGSRLQGVRALLENTTTALVAMHRHQNQGAALNAVLVERMLTAAEAEATLLELDPWQREISKASLRAEIALLLTITEGTALALMTSSATLIRHLPATLEQLTAGVLGWEHAVIIAEETTLLRQAGLPQDEIDAFEQLLLGKAEHATLPSFREKARRARERTYPETLAPKTRRAYENRRIGISRTRDGMAWLNLYGPSPTIEAIWIQCTATAQAAQGPHENRTLTQLRADIAATLLLCQSLDQNNIHAPAPAPAPLPTPVDEANGTCRGQTSSTSSTSCSGSAGATGGQGSWFSRVEQEPDPCAGGAFPDPDTTGPHFYSWQLPVFDDPDYNNPSFPEPDPRNHPDWPVPGHPPNLTPTPNTGNTTPGTSSSTAGPEGGSNSAAGTATGSDGTVVPTPGSDGTAAPGTCGPFLPDAVTAGAWPPLPTVMPVLLIPALSLLGFTDEPAWMSGAGPISIEVAKYLTANAPSFYRVLVDPISNQPLDAAPDAHRLTKAMKTMLLIRDEYCQFPGCNARAVNCEDDHIHPFTTGGPTILDNLETLCRHHHQLKHHKDDKTRNGHPRTNQSFERQSVHPRPWTPRKIPDGIEWTSPTGHHHPPEEQDTQPPVYNDGLKTLINSVLQAQQQQQQQQRQGINTGDTGDTGDDGTTAPDWEYPPDDSEYPPDEDEDYGPHWDPDNLPEPPPRTFMEDGDVLLYLPTIEDYLRYFPDED